MYLYLYPTDAGVCNFWPVESGICVSVWALEWWWYECVVSTRVGLLIRLELNCLTDDDDDHDDDVGDIESEFRSRVARAKATAMAMAKAKAMADGASHPVGPNTIYHRSPFQLKVCSTQPAQLFAFRLSSVQLGTAKGIASTSDVAVAVDVDELARYTNCCKVEVNAINR